MCVCTDYVERFSVQRYVRAIREDDGNATCALHHRLHGENGGMCPPMPPHLKKCPQCLNPDWFVPTIQEEVDFPWEIS